MPKWLKVAIPVTIVVALIFLALGINAYMHAKVEAAVARERVRTAEAERDSLAGEIVTARAVIDQSAAALQASYDARIAREREFQAQLAHVQTATPVELVDQGSAILGVTDIRTDGVDVTMSVGTYRKVVTALVSNQEYINVKEPRWLSDEALYKQQISDWKALEIKWTRDRVLSDGVIADLKDVISHNKRSSFLEKAAWAGGGFVAGYLASKLK
jgi:hypothetical protein